MSVLIPKQQNHNSWVIDVTPEMARVVDAPVGSHIVLYLAKGQVATEIIPPLSPELADLADSIADDLDDVLREMKRLGD